MGASIFLKQNSQLQRKLYTTLRKKTPWETSLETQILNLKKCFWKRSVQKNLKNKSSIRKEFNSREWPFWNDYENWKQKAWSRATNTGAKTAEVACLYGRSLNTTRTIIRVRSLGGFETRAISVAWITRWPSKPAPRVRILYRPPQIP